EDDGSDRWTPHVSGSEGARAGGGLGRPGPRRERAVLGRLSAQSQKRLFKTFFNLNYFLNAIPFIKNTSLAQINPRKI
ncbi:hypothetical protein M2T59_28150, partial [Klebsiella pneumoniae]|nr:hypothetical protein [Klebsiella pneumoniae]